MPLTDYIDEPITIKIRPRSSSRSLRPTNALSLAHVHISSSRCFWWIILCFIPALFFPGQSPGPFKLPSGEAQPIAHPQHPCSCRRTREMGRSRHSLAPWLVLACALSGVSAGKRPFNIHDDLLAYPQVYSTIHETTLSVYQLG